MSWYEPVYHNSLGIEWTGFDDLIKATPTIAEQYLEEEVVEPQKEAAIQEVRKIAAEEKAKGAEFAEQKEAEIRAQAINAAVWVGLGGITLWWLLNRKR